MKLDINYVSSRRLYRVRWNVDKETVKVSVESGIRFKNLYYNVKKKKKKKKKKC